MSKLLFIVFFSFILAGCSNKQLYQAGQDYQKSKCIEDAALEQQHNDCLNTDNKTYKEYDKERKDTINK
ncbi:hypothetical protein [Colwellia piezophila]|uniref:hypothetical protein n=1 Tax=Colwellia piezophila TaxID=211668 RepID=UPI00037D1897|nr:hypothetical protein [Colwellia piezophila]